MNKRAAAGVGAEDDGTNMLGAVTSAREYELVRRTNGYGFTLSGEFPSVVTSILPLSSADENGLQPGMLVLEVDGIDVSRARHEDVVGLVAGSRDTVRLLCTVCNLDVDDSLANRRSASAGIMNEQAAIARRMSLPSSDESLPLNQAMNGQFVPADNADGQYKVKKQRKSLMLALAAGREEAHVRTREALGDRNAVGLSPRDESERDSHQDSGLRLGYSVVRFPVAYFGSVQVTATSKVTQQGRVDTIRRCVARVQAEGRCAPVTLEATSTSISLINTHGRVLIEIPAHQLAYSCICIDDTRFFAIVTRRLRRHEKHLSTQKHPLCHVFMVNGSRRYTSQDSLNQSAQETSHILKSIADVLKTSKRQKGVQLSQPSEQIIGDHAGSGSSDGQQPGVFMIGRTVSVDNIIEQSSNDWRGMSDPDLFNPNLLNVDIRRKSFHVTSSPSLPTDMDIVGRYPNQPSHGSNTIENDQPPDDYPEVWEVSDQDSIVDLPPPPPPLLETLGAPQRKDLGCSQASPYHSELPRQSGSQKAREMSSQLSCNIDQPGVNEDGINGKMDQAGVTVSKSNNFLDLPDWFTEDYIPRLQSLEGRRGRVSREKTSLDAVRSHGRIPRVSPIERDVAQHGQGVDFVTSTDPDEKLPVSPGAQSHGYVNDINQGGTLLNTSMDSLALMSTVGSEYSVRGDVKRIASWALSLTRLLKDPEGVACLTEFMRSEHSDENLSFWLQCQEFAELRESGALQAEAQMIYDEFLSESAPTPVNIDFHTIHQVAASLNCPHKDMFAKAQREVFRLMKMDCHPRFIRSTLYQQCVVAEMENLPLPIDPLSPKAKVKVQLRSSSFQCTSRTQGADEPAQTKSSLSISSGYGSQTEERKKKEKEKKRRGIFWGIRRKVKSQSAEELDGHVGDRNSAAVVLSEEGRLDEFKQLADVSGGSNEQMFRVILPDSSSTIVMAKHGRTVKEALQKLFDRRKLEFELLDVVIQSNGEVVPYEAPVSCLHNKEVRLQSAGLTFKALFADNVHITVKVNKKKTIRDVLSGVMTQRGLDIDCHVVHLDNCPVPLQLDISSTLLVNQTVLIKPTAQITREIYENESSASPDRGYQSERPSSSLSMQSEQSNALKVKTRNFQQAHLDLKATKSAPTRSASDDAVTDGELTTCLPSSPRGRKREDEVKKMRKSGRKKKDDARVSTEVASRGLMPAPSTDDLITLLNRIQCDRLDDQRTGLPSPDPLPDLLIQRTQSQSDVLDGGADRPPLLPRSDSNESRRSLTLPVTVNEMRQLTPPFGDDGISHGRRSPNVAADRKWVGNGGANDQSLSVPDLCPVDDPTFACPPDITDVDVGDGAVTRRAAYARSRRKEREPVTSTPTRDAALRGSQRFGDVSTRQERRRVERSLMITQHPIGRYQLSHEQRRESKRRDRLVGQKLHDASGMSETSVTFV